MAFAWTYVQFGPLLDRKVVVLHAFGQFLISRDLRRGEGQAEYVPRELRREARVGRLHQFLEDIYDVRHGIGPPGRARSHGQPAKRDASKNTEVHRRDAEIAERI